MEEKEKRTSMLADQVLGIEGQSLARQKEK